MTPVAGRTTGVKQLPCHTGGTVKLRGFEQKRFTTRASVFESPHRLLIPGNSHGAGRRLPNTLCDRFL